MHRRTALIALGGFAAAPLTQAALDIGERAPAFSLPAALAGRRFTFSLSEALARGPVALYFFPLAFSEGCSIEAHSFAEAMPAFEALGATVAGISTDDIDTLARFSVQACNGKFPVISDEGRSVVRSFDAAMQTRPDHANRVSYLIAPDGKILFTYLNLNPDRHVDRILSALRQWRQSEPLRR
jgi:thioredoxin-dependent peroxiredoxin